MVFAIAVTSFATGCPRQPTATRGSGKGEQVDALAAVRQTVRKDHKPESFRTAVAQLNVYLSRPSDSKPEAASASERDMLSKQLHLTDDEMKEVVRDDFSPLDAHYLDECFLFHDAVRALKLDFSQKTEAAQLERGRLGFAWAMRQVWLNDRPTRPLPAGYALRMGYGNLMERCGVSLAILQVIGIDAGMVGVSKNGATLQAWSIAARVGNEVYLFDPRGGKPVPGPGGKGIATLRQARATPELVKESIQANVANADVKATVADSKIWLSPPLSALSPRMRWLQTVLKLNPPITLGVDFLSDVSDFAKAGETVGFWNPAGDPTAPTRRLSHFLPASDGGFESAPPGRRLFDEYRRALLPLAQMPELLKRGVLTGDPANRLNEAFARRFVDFQLDPDKPRDQVLRGHYDDANNALVDLLSQSAILRRRIANEPDLDAGALKWAEDLRHAMSRVEKLKRDKRSEPEIQEAAAQVRELEKTAEKMVLLIERSAADPYEGVAIFQMALCKHEQAERVGRTRDDEPDVVRAAWQNAAGWWHNYLDRFGSAAWIPPAQIQHAKNLLAEAQSELAKRPGK
jgi:hypothetical protein